MPTVVATFRKTKLSANGAAIDAANWVPYHSAINAANYPTIFTTN